MLKRGAASMGVNEKEGRQNVQEGRLFGQEFVPPPFQVDLCSRTKKLKLFISPLNYVYGLVNTTCKAIELKVNSLLHRKPISFAI